MRLLSCLRRVLCLAGLLSAGLLHGQSYTSVVVFGDSLSDTGNLANVIQAQFAVRYPGVSFNYADGRFTNATTTTPAATAYTGVWVEQLAAGFASKPAVKNSLNGGNNYAYGDATTADGYQTVTVAAGVTINVPNMGQQVTTYLATNPVPKATTLYILFGGSNDLFADSSTASVTAAAQQEAALVQRLITAGATQFLVPNLPPLGNTPEFAGTSQAAPLNTASAQFRTMLAADLQTVLTQAAGKGVAIYQPDLYTQTTAAANNPMTYGLTNVMNSEQGTTVTLPDTYLIWDDVHPTATGHHFIAQAAEGTLVTLAASSTALTVAALTTSGGLTLKAVVTGTGPTTKPSGLVTFFGTTGSTTTPLAEAVLDATGTGTAAYTGTSPVTVTAVYAGDIFYNNSLPATVTVPANYNTTTTMLTATSAALNSGASDTFTATVASSSGIPAGSVTFLDGTATLGTGTLSGTGVAMLQTSALAVGTHNISAVYGTNGTYSGSTSNTVPVVVTAPSVTLAFSPGALTITHGSSGTVTVSVTAAGGATGVVTLSCGALPAHASCTFSPATVTLNGTAVQTSTLTIGTSAVSALAMPARPGSRRVELAVYACSLLPLFGLGLAFRRKRWAPGLLAFALLLGVGTVGLAGCGGGTATVSTTTTPGTYSVVVTATVSGNAAATSQAALSVVVQ